MARSRCVPCSIAPQRANDERVPHDARICRARQEGFLALNGECC